MMPVPRPSQRAADEEAHTHVNGKVDSPAPAEVEANETASVKVDEAPAAADDTSLLPVLADDSALAMPRGPVLQPDPGLYAVLGLDPSASDSDIQTTYRRQASKLMGGGSNDNYALKQLNIAYEVLGNPVRRAEYDRLRVTQALTRGTQVPARPPSKGATRVTRRRRPRHAVQPRYAGMGDVLVVLMVVGLAVAVGFLLIPRLSVNLSALNALQAVLPLSSNPVRRAADPTVTPAPTAQATATPLPSVSSRYASTNVSMSNPTPAQNSTESVQIRLRRDGQAVPDADVWASVQYRTTEERWPPTGSVKTDANGAANISFNIGAATRDYPVTVHVYTQVEEQQLSWSTTFTPH